MTLTKDNLVADLRNLGVKEGQLINVKASLKSMGFVEGGAATLVEALLEAVGPEGTIVTDSFVDVHSFQHLVKNEEAPVDAETPSYAGALANAMINHPRSERSDHPIQKFALIGKLAKELARNHTIDSHPYGVLLEMMNRGGINLKIGTDEKVVGVGTTHVVIVLLSYRQKRTVRGVRYKDEQGNVHLHERNWVGGCGRGFNNFISEYRDQGGIISEALIGEAPSKLTDMKITGEIEKTILLREPEFFKCADPGCVDCRISWDHVSNQPIKFFFTNLVRRNWDAVLQQILLLARGKWYASLGLER